MGRARATSQPRMVEAPGGIPKAGPPTENGKSARSTFLEPSDHPFCFRLSEMAPRAVCPLCKARIRLSWWFYTPSNSVSSWSCPSCKRRFSTTKGMVVWGILGGLLGGLAGSYLGIRLQGDWKPLFEAYSRVGKGWGFLAGCIVGLEVVGTFFTWLKVNLVAEAPISGTPPD
jgi:hypothetical protein